MISKGSELLLNSLTVYYDKYPEYRNVLNNIVQGNYKVSLRVIDWFITHYSKYKNILYWIDEENNKIYENILKVGPHLRKFHLYLEYRAQLKSYTKLYFDPFRRHERISFILEHKPITFIETTIGQLNFFKWIFQNHILEYIESHQKEIEKQMNEYQNSKKKEDPLLNKNDSSKDIIPKQARGQCKSISNMFFQSQCCLRFD